MYQFRRRRYKTTKIEDSNLAYLVIIQIVSYRKRAIISTIYEAFNDNHPTIVLRLLYREDTSSLLNNRHLNQFNFFVIRMCIRMFHQSNLLIIKGTILFPIHIYITKYDQLSSNYIRYRSIQLMTHLDAIWIRIKDQKRFN